MFPEQQPTTLRCRNNYCGHAIHPALKDCFSKSSSPQCPCCRMNNAMHDIQRSQEIIMSHGGVHQWRDKTRKSQYFYNQWESKVRGGVRKIMDIHGNDASYRSAKKRLYNLAIELGEWSVLERAWELEKESEPEVFAAEPGLLTAEMEKMEKMEFSATNAVALYNGALQQGVFRKVDDDCERYTQKRGREWEVSTSAEYPESECPFQRRSIYPHRLRCRCPSLPSCVPHHRAPRTRTCSSTTTIYPPNHTSQD
jgi:hypothetical protein